MTLTNFVEIVDRLYDKIVNIVQKKHENMTKKAITTFIDSVVGSMPKCAEDLRDALPSTASMAKLEHFNEKWKANQLKSKRASIIDTQAVFSKRAQKEMDTASMSTAPEEGFASGSITRQSKRSSFGQAPCYNKE